MRVLEKCEPKKVFEFFEDICAIPHGSGNTKMISDYLVSFAKERSLEYIQDEINNVIIKKEASAGYENAPTVILQGHIDMVCAKKEDCTIDFEKDPLTVKIDGDWIYAEGTSLGGDNGSAVAMALAILDDDSLKHPKIEAVFTVDEETGMYGAEALDFSNLEGRWLLNMDSEDDREITVSCAGGVRTDCILPLTKEEKKGEKCTITIDGLLGGHSGIEINKGRANANKLMGRLLYAISKEVPFGVADIRGGVVENAIALKAEADILVSRDDKAKLCALVSEFDLVCKNEYAKDDPGVSVRADFYGEKNLFVADEKTTENMIFLLISLPNGVFAMSSDFPGVTQTSLNMGVVSMSDSEMRVAFSVRSSIATQKYMLKDQLRLITERAGGRVEFHGEYPAWEYKRNSPLRSVVLKSYVDVFGTEPKIAATHGGLECGLFSGKVDDLDCVSYGPNMVDVHTPLEKLSISSTEKIYKLTLAILENCKA